MPLCAARFLFRAEVPRGAWQQQARRRQHRSAPSAPGPQPFQLHIADRRAEQQRIQSCQHERDHARTPGRDVLALPCSKCRKRQQDQPDGNRILRLRERAVRALRQPRQRE